MACSLSKTPVTTITEIACVPMKGADIKQKGCLDCRQPFEEVGI